MLRKLLASDELEMVMYKRCGVHWPACLKFFKAHNEKLIILIVFFLLNTNI